MTTDDTDLGDVLDRLRSRFYGKYRGTVTAVDPGTLRIKAKVPAVLKDQPSGWCVACLPYAGPNVGVAFLPDVGAGVWIEFEAGDVSYPIWAGCYWRQGEPPADVAPAVKAIVTGQHKLLFDDDAGSVTLTDSNGNSVTLDDAGITLKRNDMTVVVGDDKVAINDDGLEVT